MFGLSYPRQEAYKYTTQRSNIYRLRKSLDSNSVQLPNSCSIKVRQKSHALTSLLFPASTRCFVITEVSSLLDTVNKFFRSSFKVLLLTAIKELSCTPKLHSERRYSLIVKPIFVIRESFPRPWDVTGCGEGSIISPWKD